MRGPILGEVFGELETPFLHLCRLGTGVPYIFLLLNKNHNKPPEVKRSSLFLPPKLLSSTPPPKKGLNTRHFPPHRSSVQNSETKTQNYEGYLECHTVLSIMNIS